MREVIEKPIIHDILNDTALQLIVSSAKSSSVSAVTSFKSEYSSSIVSSSGASSMSSLIKLLMAESNNAQQSIIRTSTIPTTTLNYDYTSYRIKVPTKFKYCNPTTRKDLNGSLIEPDECMTINASCCPCSSWGVVEGVLKPVGWGGSIDYINAKYYDEYRSNYLKNCTGFGVVCRMASSPTGCKHEAACIGGICKEAARY
jgi:hypothetical protein